LFSRWFVKTWKRWFKAVVQWRMEMNGWCHLFFDTFPQGIFRMIRDGNFADHRTFRKATRETFERYGFLKRELALIGWRSPFSRIICRQDIVDTMLRNYVHDFNFFMQCAEEFEVIYSNRKSSAEESCLAVPMKWHACRLFGAIDKSVLGMCGCACTEIDCVCLHKCMAIRNLVHISAQ
jgi:hypothetical protein